MTFAQTNQSVMIEQSQSNSRRRPVSVCQDGNDQSIQSLYSLYSNRLYLLALRLMGNKADAEEVVQDCFLRAWRKIHTFRGDAAVSTWLYRITVNLCRDRQKKRRPSDLQSNHETATAPTDTFAKKYLESALARLPNRYREVLVMHDVMEMKHHEIADILNIAVGTSKSQLHKSRAQMRQLLKVRGITDIRE